MSLPHPRRSSPHVKTSMTMSILCATASRWSCRTGRRCRASRCSTSPASTAAQTFGATTPRRDADRAPSAARSMTGTSLPTASTRSTSAVPFRTSGTDWLKWSAWRAACTWVKSRLASELLGAGSRSAPRSSYGQERGSPCKSMVNPGCNRLARYKLRTRTRCPCWWHQHRRTSQGFLSSPSESRDSAGRTCCVASFATLPTASFSRCCCLWLCSSPILTYCFTPLSLTCVCLHAIHRKEAAFHSPMSCTYISIHNWCHFAMF